MLRRINSRCEASRHQRQFRVATLRVVLLLSAWLSSSSPRGRAAAAAPVFLTDKTFDSVREAFDHPSMLILSYTGEDEWSSARNRKALDEFDKISDNELLRDKGIMLATVDTSNSRMLVARLGLSMNELPSLIFLQGERIYRYQGDQMSSGRMRSYALQGYLNQGEGELMPDASYRLLVKAMYLRWLFDETGGMGQGNNVNVTALVFSGFVVGLSCFAIVAAVVSIRIKDGGVSEGDTKKRKQQ